MNNYLATIYDMEFSEDEILLAQELGLEDYIDYGDED
jgi:hypothetical protein